MAAVTAKNHCSTNNNSAVGSLLDHHQTNNNPNVSSKKMSWQQYVDTHIVGTGDATGGLIAGLDGSIWANSPDVQNKVSSEELQSLCKAYSNPGDVQVNGAHLAGEKWRVVKVSADDGWIHLKKGAQSAHVIKTDKALLIGFNDGSSDKVTEGKTSTCVQKLGDYLKSQGY